MDCETFKEVSRKLNEEYDIEPRSTEPWEEVCLTILSQNTNDDNRDKAFESLWSKWSTPEELLTADIEELESSIAPAGLQQSKAEYLINAAKYIVNERSGDTSWIRDESVESVHEELSGIKGVGHKTADVILMFSADADLCPVDTHVHRISNRLGIVRDATRKATRDRLLELEDECGVELRQTHVSLITHGREICKARNPRCSDCRVEKLCEKNGVD